MTTMIPIFVVVTTINIAQVTSFEELKLYGPNETDGKERIRLGYMTGSENKDGDMFY